MKKLARFLFHEKNEKFFFMKQKPRKFFYFWNNIFHSRTFLTFELKTNASPYKHEEWVRHPPSYRIRVISKVSWRISNARHKAWHKKHEHHARSDKAPCELPVDAGFRARHPLDIARKSTQRGVQETSNLLGQLEESLAPAVNIDDADNLEERHRC